MSGLKVAAITIGCKVNQYDTTAIIEQFLDSGYSKAEFNEKADVYIISTCAVTAMADKKSRQMINRAKKNNDSAIVVAVGCLSQSEGEGLKEKCRVDIVVGNTDRDKIADIVSDYMVDNDVVGLWDKDIRKVDDFEELHISTANDKTRAFIKVQEGCNNFCSYCIIPYVRGKARSRKAENIIKEVKTLVRNGVLEVVLTGIHVSSYGVDFEDDIDLLYLIKKLDKIDGLKRIRLGSIEAMLITQDFCEQTSKIEKFCPHFHLSLQSGSTSVLKRMNRKYTAEQYFECVKLIKQYFEDPAITTDIIVGFPGESEFEFNETYEFVKKIGFSKIHVFPYSIRKGTVAATMSGQIDGSIKKKRVAILSELDEILQAQYVKLFLDKEVSVLFEDEDKDIKGNHIGHTNRYVKVSGKAKHNEILNVKISKINGFVGIS